MKKVILISFVVILGTAIALQAEFQVNTYTNEHQYHPAIAMNQQGDFLVLWRSDAQDGGVWGLYGQRYDFEGNPVGSEFKINTTACFNLSTWWPSAAIHSSGSFVVVWTQRDPITYYGDVVARMYDANGTPLTGEFFVNTNDLYHQGEASVAMNDSGDFVIVWQSWHGDPADPYSGYWVTGRLYDASGTPKGDEFVITQLQQGRYADVVMDNSGDFVVAWLRTGDSSDPPMGDFIRFRRYNTDGTPKDDAVQITDDIGGDFKSKKPSIAMDGDGNFVIAWAATGDYEIYAQRFDPNATPIGSRLWVNTYTDSYQGCASVAMNEEGKFVIVWRSTNQDGSDMGIFGQKYDSEGTRIDEEFQVNTYTQGRQWLPCVAMSQSGRFVTVWQDEDGHDGSGYGIFAEFGQLPRQLTYYVDRDAAGANNGSSWADAYNDLQDALAAATSSDEIWVAAGTYKPTTGSSRTATFQLINGVAIYGGFAGGESSLDERDWKTNETILSGDIGTPGDSSDNSYHVVTGSGTDATAVLDGFIITAGNANGSFPDPTSRGGGMYNNQGSPTLTNCTFSSNSAGGGGGMYNWRSSPTLTRCTFNRNSAGYDGGGMYNGAYSSPILTTCTFNGNSAGNYGGGMRNYSGCSPKLTNCTFSNNSANYNGGGMFNDGGSPTITNCILWGDTAASDGNEIAVANSSTIDVNYCDVQGGQTDIYNDGTSTVNWGTGNIDDDPLFIGPNGRDGIPGTADDEDDNVHLSPSGSPCINAGDPTGNYTGQVDIDGQPRIAYGRVDMGADEVFPIAGDFEPDGDVDFVDFAIFAGNWLLGAE